MIRNFGLIFMAAICLALATPVGAAGAGGNSCQLHATARPASCPSLAGIASLPPAVRANHVFFPGGGAVLDATARKQLDALAEALAQPIMRGTCLRLVGHTDPSGPADINDQISRLRAQAVADYLTSELGDQTPNLMVAGRGEDQLLADVAKSSLAHRRVQIDARPCPT